MVRSELSRGRLTFSFPDAVELAERLYRILPSERNDMAPPSKARRKTLAREGKANPDGSYPTDTKGRAVAAKAYSTQAVRAGRMSSSRKASIDARANRELGKGKH
jgi:hypothetical protein